MEVYTLTGEHKDQHAYLDISDAYAELDTIGIVETTDPLEFLN